eukprot:423566-Rhodomonas_salina.1
MRGAQRDQRAHPSRRPLRPDHLVPHPISQYRTCRSKRVAAYATLPDIRNVSTGSSIWRVSTGHGVGTAYVSSGGGVGG